MNNGDHFSANWRQYGDRRALPRQERCLREWRTTQNNTQERSQVANNARNQTRNNFHDNRRSYSDNQINQNNYTTPILSQNNPQRQPNQHQNNSQNDNNQQSTRKTQKNDKNEKKILDCDVFVGELTVHFNRQRPEESTQNHQTSRTDARSNRKSHTTEMCQYRRKP